MKIFIISIKRLSGIVHFLIFILFALFFFYTSSAKGQDTACSQSLPPQDSIPHIPIKGESDNQTSSSTSCQNSDFSLGTFKNWSGCSGTWCNDVNANQTRCSFGPYKNRSCRIDRHSRRTGICTHPEHESVIC